MHTVLTVHRCSTTTGQDKAQQKPHRNTLHGYPINGLLVRPMIAAAYVLNCVGYAVLEGPLTPNPV